MMTNVRLNNAKADLQSKKAEYAKKFGTYLAAIDKTKADLKQAKEKGWKHFEADYTKKLNGLLAGETLTKDEQYTKFMLEQQIAKAESEIKEAEKAAKQYADEVQLGQEYFWHQCYEAMAAGKKLF